MKNKIIFIIIFLNTVFNVSFVKINYDEDDNYSPFSSIIDKIIKEAETYLGTPYKYGGESRTGIDCSAFVKRVFETFNKILPRVSKDQAKEGIIVDQNRVKEGDLIFFGTKEQNKVNHVGIVNKIYDNTIEFIHSSRSKGVTISSLKSDYWNRKLLFFKRIIF